MSYIRPLSQAPYSATSAKLKAKIYSKKFMPEFAEVTSALVRWQLRFFGKDFTGQQ
jgi:hypothetical protein